MTEADLLRKLAAIEALLGGATSHGEVDAARAAKERIEARLGALPPRCQDWHFTLNEAWSRKLFTAMAKKFGLETFRYKGQRRTSLVIHATLEKKHELWRQFLSAHQAMATHIDELAERLIRQALGEATDDVAERVEQKVLQEGQRR